MCCVQLLARCLVIFLYAPLLLSTRQHFSLLAIPGSQVHCVQLSQQGIAHNLAMHFYQKDHESLGCLYLSGGKVKIEKSVEGGDGLLASISETGGFILFSLALL